MPWGAGSSLVRSCNLNFIDSCKILSEISTHLLKEREKTWILLINTSGWNNKNEEFPFPRYLPVIAQVPNPKSYPQVLAWNSWVKSQVRISTLKWFKLWFIATQLISAIEKSVGKHTHYAHSIESSPWLFVLHQFVLFHGWDSVGLKCISLKSAIWVWWQHIHWFDDLHVISRMLNCSYYNKG